tara:strand:- start:6181 stop:7041 length:861 start_codon:yes stop_codon:yes gene_type:complete
MEYTLILNYYNKSKELLIKQLNAISKQTIKPKLIWGCFMGCEDDELLHTYQEITKDWDNACFIDSDYNFKYIGRYQLALTAPTEIIVMLDDDRIPNPQYCECMIKIVRNEECLVQQYGWQLDKRPGGEIQLKKQKIPRPVDFVGKYSSPYEECNSRYRKETPILAQADYLCGGMVFRKSSLKYLFQEDIYTTATGEDIMFCLRCKKNNIPVYIYRPNVEKNPNQVLNHFENNSFTCDNDEVILCRTNIIKHELSKIKEIKKEKNLPRDKGPGLKDILNPRIKKPNS